MQPFLKLKDVLALTRLSRSSLHRLEAAGRFPKRRRIGERAVAWKQSDIETWMESCEPIQVNAPSPP